MSQASRVFNFTKNNSNGTFRASVPVQRTKVVYLFLEASIPFISDQLFKKHFPNFIFISFNVF